MEILTVGKALPLRCSFCGKPQGSVAKLISNPSADVRVYICDECVDVCATIVKEEREEAEAPQPAVPESGEKHPLLEHPLASDLMAAVERWIRCESLGRDGAAEISDVRTIAAQMMGT